MQSSKELSDAKQEMQECQRKCGFIKMCGDVEYTRCEACDEIFECKVRKRYVDLVYMGMNKGEEGGFEF